MKESRNGASWDFIRRIISGGQTGVDRAALDFALAQGIACGGWCPNRRLAEDGLIDLKYPLTETPSSDTRQRTGWNVRDSDATLLFYRGSMEGGTLYTLQCAERINKPFQTVNLARPTRIGMVLEYFKKQKLGILNIAGPRESSCPGIYNEIMDFLVG